MTDQAVGLREHARANGGVDLGAAGGARAHLCLLDPGALGDERAEVGPLIGPLVEYVPPGTVPNQGHDEPRGTRPLIPRNQDVGEGAAVRRGELDVEEPGPGGGDVRRGHGPIDDAERLDESGSVPEHRDVGCVVPRADVREPIAYEVRRLRQDLYLAAALRVVAAGDPADSRRKSRRLKLRRLPVRDMVSRLAANDLVLP